MWESLYYKKETSQFTNSPAVSWSSAPMSPKRSILLLWWLYCIIGLLLYDRDLGSLKREERQQGWWESERERERVHWFHQFHVSRLVCVDRLFTHGAAMKNGLHQEWKLSQCSVTQMQNPIICNVSGLTLFRKSKIESLLTFVSWGFLAGEITTPAALLDKQVVNKCLQNRTNNNGTWWCGPKKRLA